MTKTLKIYFSQPQVIFYSVLALGGLTYSFLNGYLYHYWYLIFLILLLSPFIEYFIHKYFLHLPMPENPEKYPRYSKFLRAIHYDHHKVPKDQNHIFAQLWLTLPSLAFDVALVYLLTGSVAITSVVITFVIIYYLFYEWSHFLSHSSYKPKNRYSSYMKKYHLLHHYKNENYWFGITSPVADVIFGKFKKSSEVPKSLTAKNLTSPLAIEK